MAKREKNVNVKDVVKAEIMAIVVNALNEAGFEVKDGVPFGFSKGVIVVNHSVCDVQIKPIVPKSGVERYEEVE